MSIPALFEWNTVGNSRAVDDLWDWIAENWSGNCIFAKSLMGTTIQDGGKRERGDDEVQ